MEQARPWVLTGTYFTQPPGWECYMSCKARRPIYREKVGSRQCKPPLQKEQRANKKALTDREKTGVLLQLRHGPPRFAQRTSLVQLGLGCLGGLCTSQDKSRQSSGQSMAWQLHRSKVVLATVVSASHILGLTVCVTTATQQVNHF